MKYFIPSLLLLIVVAVSSCKNENEQVMQVAAIDSTLTLPGGFVASIFADSLGSVRHMAYNSNGDLYVRLAGIKNGHGILRLTDSNNDGVADSISGFGDYGGTGIAIKNGYLYASSNDNIYRYKLDANGNPDTSSVEMIIEGLINKGQHAAKAFTLDDAGNIYVNVGAPSNSCQVDDRQPGSPGRMPCPILDSAGGIWQFRTDKANQHYSDGTRYCTGIRNIVALDWNSQANDLYAVMHGRDDLDRMFPNLFTESQRVELPAEEMLRIQKGDDFGWPYCYYDGQQKKKVQSPEYGGDGKKIGDCGNKKDPIYAFPAHWAPDGLLFYTGDQFPEKYKNGAFIAFHGSWNRAPQEQAGYKVIFLPFNNGMPSGDYEVFASGFEGAKKSPNEAAHRPCGLAQGTDGSLYISDDQQGRVWKVSYKK